MNINISPKSEVKLDKMYQEYKKLSNITIDKPNSISFNNNVANVKQIYNELSNSTTEIIDFSDEFNIEQYRSDIEKLVSNFELNNDIEEISSAISLILTDIVNVDDDNLLEDRDRIHTIYNELIKLGIETSVAEDILEKAWINSILDRGFDILKFSIRGKEITIYTQKNANYLVQDLNIEKLISQLKEVPDYLLKGLDHIFIYDGLAKRNLFYDWKNNPEGYVTVADASTNLINIYACGIEHNYDTLVHEITHVYDISLAKELNLDEFRFSQSSAWLNAIAADNKILNDLPISDYPGISEMPEEDFAESVKYYFDAPEKLDKFPNRKKLLQEIFGDKNDDYQSNLNVADTIIIDSENINLENDLKYVVDSMMKIYNDKGLVIEALEKFLETGNLIYIVNQNNVYDILQKYNMNEIREAIEFSNSKANEEINMKTDSTSKLNINYVEFKKNIDKYLKKYGINFLNNIIKEYLKSGNIGLIPTELRPLFLKYSYEELENLYNFYLKNYNSNLAYNNSENKTITSNINSGQVEDIKDSSVNNKVDDTKNINNENINNVDNIKDNSNVNNNEDEKIHINDEDNNYNNSKEFIIDLVRKTMHGDFGNGENRKKALGAYYEEVQKQINLNIQNGNTLYDEIKYY